MPRRFPEWIKFKAPAGSRYREIKKLLKTYQMHTICQEALCPNIGECFERGTVTFMILGDICTRQCGYCNVGNRKPLPPVEKEPERLTEIVELLQLKHVVITSPTRDDLPDGGSGHFARTIRLLKQKISQLSVEVLIPDFKGIKNNLYRVLEEGPDILNHNVETVPRLFRVARRQGNYEISLKLLARAKEFRPDIISKSGIIIGLGESVEEIKEMLQDLRKANCEFLTIGQYLQPSTQHLKVEKFYSPGEFEKLRVYAEMIGFLNVESGPGVRSSYYADVQKLSLSDRSDEGIN